VVRVIVGGAEIRLEVNAAAHAGAIVESFTKMKAVAG